MNMHKIQVIILCFIPVLLHSQEKDAREQILRYGIENDVISVLGDLTHDKIASYNELLAEILPETRNPQILQGIFRLWEETEYEAGLPFAREELDRIIQDLDFSEDVSRSALTYIAEMKDIESTDVLLKLTEDRNSSIAEYAVRALGKTGAVSDKNIAQTLLDRLKNLDTAAEDELAIALITALGDLRYEQAGDELLYIMENEGSPVVQRRIACISLGKIGRREDYPVIERVYLENDSDSILRSYALAGLAEFEGQDITPVLVQALKRDSFWRIRVTAAEKLTGQDSKDIQALLQYKAVKDPVKQVRIASLGSLAATGDRDTHDFLFDYIVNEQYDTESRLAGINALINNKVPGTVDALETVINELWEEDQNRFFEFTSRELSLADWSELSPLYERMLTHSNWLIVVYAVRGIRRNHLGMEEKIKALDAEGVDGRIRREVKLPGTRSSE